MHTSIAMSGVAHTSACPPTAIEHCAVACFASSAALESSEHLVLSRGTVLEVYALHEEGATTDSASAGAAGQRRAVVLDGIASAQLELLARSELNGRIASLRVVRPLGSATDLVLLAFADAKLSVLTLDETGRALRTLCVHSFESIAETIGCVDARVPPLLRVLPGGEYVMMLCYGSSLVLLPTMPADGGGPVGGAGVVGGTKAAPLSTLFGLPPVVPTPAVLASRGGGELPSITAISAPGAPSAGGGGASDARAST